MTKKIHVLADESLGGIKREYVEVDRKARVGDLVGGPFYFNHGPYYRIIDTSYDKEVVIQDISNGIVYSSSPKYHTILESTDIVHIEGKRYKLVDRKAEVGERVIVTSEGGGWYDDKIGEVFDVIDGEAYVRRTYEDLVSGDVYVESGRNRAGKCSFISYDNYLVLVSVEESPKTKDDIIANLVRRVAQLERQNEAMLDVYERGQKWTHERINGVKDDIEDLRDELGN